VQLVLGLAGRIQGEPPVEGGARVGVERYREAERTSAHLGECLKETKRSKPVRTLNISSRLSYFANQCSDPSRDIGIV
jgi:hypothetical protein